MGADVLATQGAGASATMILTMFDGHNSVPLVKSNFCLQMADFRHGLGLFECSVPDTQLTSHPNQFVGGVSVDKSNAKVVL